ncbi:non-ribosomal peptide synthetase [Acrocarpospora sp. B8E8]|uniref:non-ribosomal peptide synthetase n=1 Tax=Acrocarpospora sp. B8E8 TaxID=3153572 RepID=UPI00325CDB34
MGLSLVYGGDLPESGPRTLPELLARASGVTDAGMITYLRADGSELTRSYPELLAEAEAILTGLRAQGLRPSDPVLLQIDDNHDYLPTFWACVLGGMPAVPMTVPPGYEQPSVATARLRRSWELCGRPLIVASSRVAPELDRLGMGLTTVDALRSHPARSDWYPAQPDDPFAILFTSGSTGVPKGVTLTHRGVLAMLRGYLHLVPLTSEDISFNWMPLEHVAGLLAFHVRDVYLGARQIHAGTEAILRDPLSWLDRLDHYRATCTWAPNFAFNLINEHLAEHPGRSWDLSAIRHILNAGETIVPATMRRFLTSLGLRPDVMHPSWGMSETTAGVTFSDRLGQDRFVDVGPVIPGVWLRVTDAAGQILPEGEIGRIQVKGPTVTPGYYRNPERVFTADGWFDTGDLGVLRDGRLTITGREKDIIIVNGLNYYCQEIEAVVEEISGVEATYTAACAVRADGDDTESLAVFYCGGEEHAPEIRSRVLNAVGISPAYVIPLAKEAVPKTETGKIRRGALRELFDQGAFPAVRLSAAVVEPRSEIERTLLDVWRRALGVDQIGVHDDFYDLGGDSLVGMRVTALVQNAGLPMKPWHLAEHPTIAELAAELEGM